MSCEEIHYGIISVARYTIIGIQAHYRSIYSQLLWDSHNNRHLLFDDEIIVFWYCQVVGNAQREYEKAILLFSVKNQLRYKGNLGRLKLYMNVSFI